MLLSTGDGGFRGDPYDNALNLWVQNHFIHVIATHTLISTTNCLERHFWVKCCVSTSTTATTDSSTPFPKTTPSSEWKMSDPRFTPTDSETHGACLRIPATRTVILNDTMLTNTWHYLWRNFCFFFLKGAGRGRIFIGDVGQNAYEEIDVLASGANFGWSAYEAKTCYKPEFCEENGE